MNVLKLMPSNTFGEPTLEQIKIKNTLEDLQREVGGYIECVYDLEESGISMWCNDEGKMSSLDPTLWIYDRQDAIFGNVVFTGTSDDGDTIALTEKQKRIVKEYVVKNVFTAADMLHLIFK